MERTKENVVSAARAGAARYADTELELLKKFSGIDCGTRDVEGNGKVVEILDKEFEAMGITPEHIFVEGLGTHLIARIPAKNGGKGKIIVNAHIDSAFQKGDVEKFPFRIEGDMAYGLGIADCKGGVAVSLYAVRIMKEAGLLPDKEIVIIYSCDEEGGSFSSREIFKKESEGAEFAFVFEPGRNKNGILTSREGIAAITMEIEGKEAHASNAFTEGRSATVELAHKIIKLHEKCDYERGIFYNTGPLKGGFSGGTVPAHAWGEAFASLPDPTAYDKVVLDAKAVEEDTYIEGCKSKVTPRLLWPTMERDEKTLSAYALVREAGLLLGTDLPEEASKACSDACWFWTYGVPSVDGLGPYMYDIHTTNEHLKISTIKERTELFAVTLGLL